MVISRNVDNSPICVSLRPLPLYPYVQLLCIQLLRSFRAAVVQLLRSFRAAAAPPAQVLCSSRTAPVQLLRPLRPFHIPEL